MANIKDYIENIRSAIFGKEVRGSLADGLAAINKETENTTSRQRHLEDTFDQLIINSGDSNAEIVDARVGENGSSFNKLGDRLDNFDSNLAEIEIEKANKNDVAKISTGTPLFVKSVSEMTNNTRVYVNTSDGYLYVYNGSVFEKSNVLYQSTGLGDNTVTPEKLYGSAEFENIYREYRDCINGKYISAEGEIKSSENGSYAKIKIKPLTKYSILKQSGNYHVNSGAILFMNSNEEIISILNGADFINGYIDLVPYITIESPANSKYILVNVRLTGHDDRKNLFVSVSEYMTSNDDILFKIFDSFIGDKKVRKNFSDFIDSIKTTGKNIYDYNTSFIDGKLSDTEGNVRNAEGFGVAKIRVEQNKTYSLFLPSNIYSTAIGTISFYNNTTKLDYKVANTLINGKYNGKDYITFTTPENCDLFYVTCKKADLFDDSKTLLCYEGDKIDSDIVGEYITSINGHEIKTYEKEEIKHELYGLKWGFIGDSLTNKNQRALKNYVDYIVEDTGVIAVNLGESGTGYKKQEENNKAFYQRVKNIDNDFDIITIFGSGNDLSLDLGTVTDNDTSTVFGCVNETIKNIYAKMPTVKLGIISPTPWGGYPNNVENNKMQQLSDGLEKICKNGSIPFLNLYHCSNLRPWDETFRQLMYSRDEGNSVHPDENGHKQFYKKILRFAESL